MIQLYAKLTLMVTVLLTALSALALPEDSQQPIHVASDKAFIDRPGGTLVYTGNVKMNQGTLRIEADKITITQNDDGLQKVVAEGKPARYEQVINPKQDKTHAFGETIIYETYKDQLTLLVNAGLTKQGNEFKGEKIVYLIEQQKVKAESPKQDERIRMVIQPKKNGEKQEKPPTEE